jgi:Adenylate and Guanylate cyclase catalytic domain
VKGKDVLSCGRLLCLFSLCCVLQFDEFGGSVLKNALSNTYQIFAELDSIGVYITSMVLHASVQFQLASTLKNFGRITQRTFNILPVNVINYSPIVTKENRPAWELFAANQTTSSLSSSTSSSSSSTSAATPTGKTRAIIYNQAGPIPQDAPGPFVPLWHTSSIDLSYEERVSKRENFDLLSYTAFREAFQQMLHHRHGVISEPITDWDALSLFTGIQYTPDMVLEPYSFVLQPVFDGLGVGQHDIAGVVTALVPLRFILQKSRGGILSFFTVLHDSCGNQAYTYEHQGSKISYVGPSQRYDRQFDAWAVSMDDTTTVMSLVSRTAGHATDEVGVIGELEDGTKDCPFRLSVYPTVKFREEYLTQLPWIVFGVVVAIFICMGCLFARYDILLTRRQTSLMNHALRTTHIIESLFPSNVHQRMFETSRDAGKVPGSIIKNSRKGSDVARVLDAMNGGKDTKNVDDGGDGDHAVVNGMYTTKPIADLFPHTTIMFADIVGFTAWSSQREPTQVFALLETLFRAFDKIAKRLNVFKVRLQ